MVTLAAVVPTLAGAQYRIDQQQPGARQTVPFYLTKGLGVKCRKLCTSLLGVRLTTRPG